MSEHQVDRITSVEAQGSEQSESIVSMEAPPSGEQLIPAATDGWIKILLKPRVDSLNHDELIDELKAHVDSGLDRIALDLGQNRFVSVTVIKVCVEIAEKLAEMGGALALVRCSERTKRHFEVYGSTDHVRFVRSEAGLQALMRPRFTKASSRVAS